MTISCFDMPRQSSRLGWPVVGWLFVGEDAIEGFSTPMFLGLVQAGHPRLLLDVSMGSTANGISGSAEQRVVRLSSKGSLLVSLTSVR